MKLLFSLLVTAILCIHSLVGQPVNIQGRPVIEIFTDFHVSLNDTSRHTGFDQNRTFIGYQFLPEGNVSAKVIVNIGYPDELAIGSEPRRYGYFREASMTWEKNDLTLSMGIVNTQITEFQQRFWGKRYVALPFIAENCFGFVADIGLSADYQISDKIVAEWRLLNGEGYSNLQMDDNLRTSLAFNITPNDNLAFRVFGDIQRAGDLWQPLFVGFAGYKNDLFSAGAEIIYKSNIDLIQGHHVWGMSATGGINITEKTQVFGRYDILSSVVMPGDVREWNYNDDYSFTVIGAQYIVSKQVKLALSYQGRYQSATPGVSSDLVFLNATYKF